MLASRIGVLVWVTSAFQAIRKALPLADISLISILFLAELVKRSPQSLIAQSTMSCLRAKKLFHRVSFSASYNSPLQATTVTPVLNTAKVLIQKVPITGKNLKIKYP
ncbi:MAG TPA: hypothetical protein VIQ31_03790 [Phormidium sp.]